MKKGIGFYLSGATLVLSVVALAAYFINCGTAYFSKLGTNPVVIGCFAAGIVLALASMFLSKVPVLGDAAIICAPAALIYGLINFVNDRVVGIAAIFTFENNASNMADLTSCLVAMVVTVLAVIVGVVSSFTPATK